LKSRTENGGKIGKDLEAMVWRKKRNRRRKKKKKRKQRRRKKARTIAGSQRSSDSSLDIGSGHPVVHILAQRKGIEQDGLLRVEELSCPRP
jgi:hypothetical protein